MEKNFDASLAYVRGLKEPGPELGAKLYCVFRGWKLLENDGPWTVHDPLHHPSGRDFVIDGQGSTETYHVPDLSRATGKYQVGYGLLRRSSIGSKIPTEYCATIVIDGVPYEGRANTDKMANCGKLALEKARENALLLVPEKRDQIEKATISGTEFCATIKVGKEDYVGRGNPIGFAQCQALLNLDDMLISQIMIENSRR